MTDFTGILNQKLRGKKILLIGVKFYHFTDEIIAKLVHYGAEVTFRYERDTTIKFGLAKTFKPEFADVLQERHYRKVAAEAEEKHFDYMLVIRGYTMQPWFVEKIKADHPGIQTILYQWDSYANWECDYRYLISSFDVVKTFDRKDAVELGLPYVPTYSSDEYADLPETETEFDIFYSGGYTGPRYEFLKQLLSYSAAHGLKLYAHLVMNQVSYIRGFLSNDKPDRSLLSFKNLSKEEYIEIFKRSNVIIDYTKDTQAGITMRTLDVLAAGKKLLTNNRYIMEEPAYNPAQIQLFDPANFSVDTDFVKRKELFPRQDFSIDKWLNNIF